MGTFGSLPGQAAVPALKGRSIRKQILRCCALSLCLSFSLDAFSQVALSLNGEPGLQGAVTTTYIHLDTDTPVAGFNAELVFPAGLTPVSVRQGALLLSEGLFSIDSVVTGQSMRVVGYSAADTLDTSGAVIEIDVMVDAGLTPGLVQLDFVPGNVVAEINSNHAVSNEDGSLSLNHGIATGPFLIYSETSDFDDDDLPDIYEVDNGLDPTVSNDGVDTDDDGFTDKEEFDAGTDPQDPNSTPIDQNIIFRNGFESNV